MTVARSLAGVERSLRLLRTILIAGGLAVLLVAALGLGLAALLRPLARMRATAQRIGDERDFSHRMPVDGDPHDELGRLSLSFNQMLAELEQANLGLKTTLDSQRRFVADASHELRTPLTAIRTNVEFLARVPGARSEDRVEALRDVLTELRRMESLVGDLLALARLEAASARPAKRTFRLDHMLADVHRDALRMAANGVEVRLGPLPEVWVSGDRDDLRRAVWNLVDNALKYTRAGKVDLRLRAEDGVAELCATPASASPRASWTTCSTASGGRRASAAWPGRAWGWPSPGGSPRPTRARSPSSRWSGTGRPSCSPCRSWRARRRVPAAGGAAARCQPGDRFGTPFLRAS